MATAERRLSRRVLPIISAVTFIGFLDTTLVVPILADYAAELGGTEWMAGLAIGLYSIANTPANVLFGRLIDRFGHRLPLIGGLAGDALGMFLYTLVRSPLHLLLVRVFHGITGAPVGPATMSAVAGYSSEEREGRSMGVYGMSIAAANLVGFGVSGVMVDRVGFRALFYLGAGVLAIGAGIGALLPRERRTVPVSGTGAAGPPAAGGFDKAKELLRRKGLIVAYVAIFAQYFSFGGVVTLLPFYKESLGLTAFHVAMMLTTFAAVFIIVQFPGSILADRKGRWLPIIAGLSLGIVSLLVLPSQTTFPLMATVMAVYGMGYGLLFPSISALVADNSRPGERGLATGIFHALLTAGVAIGGPVMGVAGHLLGARLGLLVTPVAMLAALGVALALLKRG